MKFLGSVIALLLVASYGASVHAQATKSRGDFREVLTIIGITPQSLNEVNVDQPSSADWQVLAQVVARLEQHAVDLGRWTRSDYVFTPSGVGGLFDVAGTVRRVEVLESPVPSELTKLYRCHWRLENGKQAVLLASQVPKRWELDKPIAEPASWCGVLLRAEEPLTFLTSHVSWHPGGGVPEGQLLLARVGMDAALWDEVVQRTPFVSPERGREAEAFYASLTGIAQVPSAELTRATLNNVASSAARRPAARTEQEKQIATVVAEQATRGLSSVAPLFLEPEEMLGELVRIEGTARRAVRVVAEANDQAAHQYGVREYFEVEVFTLDSQNLPIVCCVSRLPAGFPTGDAIRAAVRVEGVFFKLWRYHSRNLIAVDGQTTTGQESYTPVVMAATVTWLRQVPLTEHWWGLVVGGILGVAMIAGVIRMAFSLNARRRMPSKEPDFSSIGGE